MNQKEVEFGTQTQVSAQMRSKLLLPMFEDVITQGLISNARAQGYKPTSEPEILWDEQPWKQIGDEENGYRNVPCKADDKGAFFYVGCRMKVVKIASS